ncbi:Uma2 family endonuclease [Synechococcus sp. CCY9202]|uniref:Uma2 family endonuclease n=1 Tax=Synechococcus sp. CCY9202 TaxID=174698 RepID=UPI003A4C7373
MQLGLWASSQPGWCVFDSSTGFLLPDGSVLSPDGSAVRLERWQALTPAERQGFPPLCPDLVDGALALPREQGGTRAKQRHEQQVGVAGFMPADAFAVDPWGSSCRGTRQSATQAMNGNADRLRPARPQAE